MIVHDSTILSKFPKTVFKAIFGGDGPKKDRKCPYFLFEISEILPPHKKIFTCRSRVFGKAIFRNCYIETSTINSSKRFYQKLSCLKSTSFPIRIVTRMVGSNNFITIKPALMLANVSFKNWNFSK